MKALSILLVEDNMDHAELIIETLNDFNEKNKTTHVTNGERALKHLQECKNTLNSLPDLVLLDINMPRMNGLETLRVIREDAHFVYIPVIMISTSANDKEIHECYELGANSYITKPLLFEEFSQKINDLNAYWVMTSELPAQEQ